ncbi:MAG TPA: phosphoglycerate kinase [Pirellulales bacterium]|jgi:3-phosphoglycerate kinase|nr:phosphoglycerate kinase [Pirellulales bacterium]
MPATATRTVSAATIKSLLRALLGADPAARSQTLQQHLQAIPRLDSLADLPRGTPVLVRGDVDVKPGPVVGDGDVRLRSMADTLKFGQEHGWKQIVFGHVGRKPEGSLKAVAKRLGEIMNCSVALVDNWYDDAAAAVSDALTKQISEAAAGSILMLENTRKYKIERALWDATPDDVDKLAEPLAKFANQMADRVARVYVNEALSAGSLDTSTTIVPMAMDRVALGSYVAEEFDGPMLRCLQTKLVVFSGLKIDKLDDLEAMISRGTIRWVFTAGSLAMALKKADAEIAGGDFSLGVAEAPGHEDKPYFIERSRIEQAKKMLTAGRNKGIAFVMPCDFVLQDGRVSETIGPGDQQFDVGPKTGELFEREIGRFLEEQKHAAAAGGTAVAFHNGVFGMFEDPRFEGGTKRFIGQLKRMKDAGVEVYVGGGEGGAALEKYGKPDWVTHTFTAGGTVLNALGASPVPYLVTLAMAAGK